MSELKGRLQGDLNSARKAREKTRTSVLSMTISELRNKEIELGREVTDAEVMQVVSKAIKQRRDAADQMASGGRQDLADKEAEPSYALVHSAG